MINRIARTGARVEMVLPEFRALAVAPRTRELRVLSDLTDPNEALKAVRASCSVPLLRGAAEPFRGEALVDGGFLESVPGAFEQIDRTLYLVAAMTGLRLGELRALRWRDIDWSAQRVRVRRNYVRGQYGTPKSRRSSRSVPLADKPAGALDRLFKASHFQEPEELVFAEPDTGEPLRDRALIRRYRRALKAAGLDTTHRFHDLRHTFGTAIAATGVPPRMLQEWMGHRHLSTTQIYADYAPSPHEAAMVARAFERGSVSGSVLSESEVTSDHLNRSGESSVSGR